MAQSFDPKGKTFDQRLTAFLADAKTTYGISVKKYAGRTVAWQQKYHVAHMFLYNAYKSTKPKFTDTGSRTIAWSHFSDPKVAWNTIAFSDSLRTSKHMVPLKQW